MTRSTAIPDAGPARQLPRAFVCIYLILLITVAAFIRVHGAGEYYYNPDEAMHTNVANAKTLGQVLQFSHYEIHPPILYLFCHYWMMISADPAFVRGMLLLFGLATIPLYYKIGTAVSGELAGLACATLIAFSQGCIIQSYVVRHYMILIFFISLSFYCYLLWRNKPSFGILLAYAFFAVLACLTHFSAIFDVFCIATYETLGQLRRKEMSALPGWVIANALVGLAALYAYYLWRPILVPLKSYFAGHMSASLPGLLAHALFYPLVTPGYILPGYTAALVLLAAQTAIAITKPPFITNIAGLRSLLALNALAYGLGMLLVVTRIYPEPGTRHSLWVLPFVVVPAGWMLADLLRWLAAKISPSPHVLQAACLLLLAAGIATYNPDNRFSDSSEYVWKQNEWNAFIPTMKALGPRDLIVAEKDDGIMLASLYANMGEDAFTGADMAALTPYHNTHILFNPYYPRNYSRDILLSTLEEAQQKRMLDGVDRLIFLRMTWSRSPVDDLMMCKALNKEVILFPPGRSVTRGNIGAARAAVMILSKESLLRDVLPGDAKARACMDGRHDMNPGFIHAAQ